MNICFDRAAQIATQANLPWTELDGKTVLVTRINGSHRLSDREDSAL